MEFIENYICIGETCIYIGELYLALEYTSKYLEIIDHFSGLGCFLCLKAYINLGKIYSLMGN